LGLYIISGLIKTIFFRKLDDAGLFGINLVKLKSTSRNKRFGDDRIKKRLDKFLVFEFLVEYDVKIRQWVTFDGEFDHFPVFLELTSIGNKPSIHFKFNL
jgi:hypothetical protein